MNKITDTTQMSFFQDLRSILFTITLGQKPKGVQRRASLNNKTERGHARNSLGFCLRVIVIEKTLNLERTTSSVLSVILLIYGCVFLFLTESNLAPHTAHNTK